MDATIRIVTMFGSNAVFYRSEAVHDCFIDPGIS
jgi:hypothetical protein